MKVRALDILYIISSLICFTNRFWGIDVPYYLKYIVALPWIGILIFEIARKKVDISFKQLYAKQFYLMIIPLLLIFVFTIITWLTNFSLDIVVGNFTRLLSTILYLIITFLFILSGIYFFGKNIIYYISLAIFTSYGIGAILPFVLNYRGSIFDFFYEIVEQNDNSRKYLEVHDLTFAAGILFLYYLLFDKRRNKFRIIDIILSLIVVVIGFKKIELIAIAICLISYKILFSKRKNIKTTIGLVFLLFVIMSYSFIYLIDSGILYKFVEKYSINTSGRIEMYQYFGKYFNFSITYIGTGYTYFTKFFENLWKDGFRISGHSIAASIHSDILTLYIELGFILFFLYILYHFIIKPKIIFNSMGKKTLITYMVLTIYIFILYFTDNVSNYFSTQALYFLIPIIVMIDENNSSKNEVVL